MAWMLHVKSANCIQASKIVFVTNHQEMAMQVLQAGWSLLDSGKDLTDMRNLKREGFGRYIRMASAVWDETCEKRRIKI